MAGTATTFARSGVNDALIPEQWHRKDYEFAARKNPLMKYMAAAGQSLYGEKPFMVTEELTKGRGDRITIPMIRPVLDDGETNDGDYDGNYKKLDFLDTTVTIYERGLTLGTNGQYTIQVNYKGSDLPFTTTRIKLAEWVGDVMYSDQVCALSGIPATKLNGGWATGEKAVDADSSPILTVNCYDPTASTSATEYDAWYTSDAVKSDSHPRIFCGGQTSAGVLTRVDADSDITAWSANAHRFGTKVIDYVVEMARNEVATNSSSSTIVIPPIEPLMYDGNEYWIMFVSPEQMVDLRNDSNWSDAMSNAWLRGTDNPLFTGAEGYWNGVVIHRCSRLHKRTGAGGTTTGIVASEYFDGLPYAAGVATERDLLADGVSAARAVLFGKNALVQAYGKRPTYTEGVLDSGSKTKPSLHTDFIYGLKTPTFELLNNRAKDEEDTKYPFASILVDTAISLFA